MNRGRRGRASGRSDATGETHRSSHPAHRSYAYARITSSPYQRKDLMTTPSVTIGSLVRRYRYLLVVLALLTFGGRRRRRDHDDYLLHCDREAAECRRAAIAELRRARVGLAHEPRHRNPGADGDPHAHFERAVIEHAGGDSGFRQYREEGDYSS